MALGGTVDILATDDPDAIAEEHEELQIYEKHNNLLHGSKRKKYEHTHTHTLICHAIEKTTYILIVLY